VAIINVSRTSVGDGIEKFSFRADRDYIVDAVSLRSVDQAFFELEVSSTDVRGTGVMMKTHAGEWDKDNLSWTGWLVLRQDEWIIGHVDYPNQAKEIGMRIHLNAVSTRFQADLL